MRALMELVEGDRHIVRTVDLENKVAADVLAAARRAGIVRPEDPGFEDISASDLARVCRVVYGLSGRQRPVPALFDAAASPLGWMGTEKNAREVLLCARPGSGLAKALSRKKPTLVLVPTARHITPALRERHGAGAVVTLEALEEALVALGGRLVLRAAIAPDGPEIGVRPVVASIALVGLAKRWSQLRFCLIDSRSVRIDHPGGSVRCTHVDLGMAHEYTREPLQPWEILEEICEHGGYFQTRRFGNPDATRQAIRRFSVQLQQLFGIQGSCFYRYRSAGGWRARFEAQNHLPGDL